jgi:hypothetical protein
MKKITAFILVIVAICCTCCSKSTDTNNQNNELIALPFKVESGLLEENSCIVPEIQMEFNIPAGYKIIDQSFTDSIAIEDQKQNPFERKLLRIYFNPYTNGNIALYDIRHIPADKINQEISNYQTAYNANGNYSDISLNLYQSDNYPKIAWFTLQNQDESIVRVFFFNQEKAQFCLEYYISTLYYQQLKNYIQSSVASVKPNLEPQISIL